MWHIIFSALALLGSCWLASLVGSFCGHCVFCGPFSLSSFRGLFLFPMGFPCCAVGLFCGYGLSISRGFSSVASRSQGLLCGFLLWALTLVRFGLWALSVFFLVASPSYGLSLLEALFCGRVPNI